MTLALIISVAVGIKTYLFGYYYLAEVIAGTGKFLVDGILYIAVNFVGEVREK
ncbi:hypothetical protein SRRS_44880 [Sporomusa rhizae]|uniref:hypothetical protein n=1 Tax=Sporomusa rhizae TaxID=357999 RepID=UPI00352B8F48